MTYLYWKSSFDMLNKKQKYIYYQITHNGGEPKEFNELYFDYVGEFHTDKDLENSINMLIELNKIQAMYCNPYLNTCHKVQQNKNERLCYLPLYNDVNINELI